MYLYLYFHPSMSLDFRLVLSSLNPHKLTGVFIKGEAILIISAVSLSLSPLLLNTTSCHIWFKKSKSILLSKSRGLYQPQTPSLKSDKTPGAIVMRFPSAKVHPWSCFFLWVLLVPLPELEWIVWNKLQSSLKWREERRGEERCRGELAMVGEWRGSESWEDRGCQGQSKGSDGGESSISNFVSCPWIHGAVCPSLILIQSRLYFCPHPLGRAVSVLFAHSTAAGLIHSFVFWIWDLQR